MPGPIWWCKEEKPRLLTYDELAELRANEIPITHVNGVMNPRFNLILASVCALLPPVFRYRWLALSPDYQGLAEKIIKEAEDTKPPAEKPWPAAWEHVGPPEKPALKNPDGTAEILRTYRDQAATAAGMPPPGIGIMEVAKAATNPITWAALAPDAKLFSLGGAVFLTKSDFEERPDPRKVLWDRFIEWRKANKPPHGTDAPLPQRATHVAVAAVPYTTVPHTACAGTCGPPPLKPRRQSTLEIVKAAKAFVDEKRAQGWTREDFAYGLKEMLGITDEKSK